MDLAIPKTRIGLMGGSFNPIHLGHLLLAQTALHDFSLSRVIFIPTGKPGYPVKESPLPGEIRFQMVLLAIASNPDFFASRLEIDRKEPCFTIDTLHEIRSEYPDSQFDFYYITGADAILEILSWKNPEEILRLTSFIAGTRPNYSLTHFFDKISVLKEAKDRINLMNIPMLDISSSEIRKNLRTGKSIRYMVTDEVLHFIEKNKLYV